VFEIEMCRCSLFASSEDGERKRRTRTADGEIWDKIARQANK